jgi:hypothetical protein
MTVLDENVEKNLSKPDYVRYRLHKLLHHDRIRLFKLVEIIQYSIIYSLLGFVSAVIFDVCLPNFNPNASVIRILGEVVVQLVLFSVAVFYITKVAKLFPLIVNPDPEFHPYLTEEYVGGIALGIMFLKVQPNFGDKIGFLGKWMKGLSN